MSRQSYAKYWPSGVEWLGDLPDHWQLRRLKYATSINDETLAETMDHQSRNTCLDVLCFPPSNGCKVLVGGWF